MEKLLALKKWLSVPEAANHLTNLLSEQVAPSDIYGFALDGHLKLSVYFVNPAYVRTGHVVPLEKADRFIGYMNPTGGLELVMDNKVVGPDTILPDSVRRGLADGTLSSIITGLDIGNGKVLQLEEEIIRLDANILDLAMVGEERVEVERCRQNEIGGPDVEPLEFNGALVENSEGQLFQLQTRFTDEEIPSYRGRPFLDPIRYSPEQFLEGTLLVVRTEELVAFCSRLQTTDSPEGKLTTKERTTFENIVGALRSLLLEKKPKQKPNYSSQAQLIETLIRKFPNVQGISKRTLEQKFSNGTNSLKQY